MRPKLVIGFAAETNDLITYAKAKLAKKNCDWVVANDVSGDVMGGTHNAVALVSADKVENWPRDNKNEIATKLADRIATYFTRG
jgi:phosphopantothenoylcysteine decarboxylase / phosphopantothenate---cysteine ligase